MVISQKLGDFVPLVGGGSYAACLLVSIRQLNNHSLPFLQPLLARVICCVEEIVVVQAACDSLIKIIPTLDSNVVDTNCLQLVRNVFAGTCRLLVRVCVCVLSCMCVCVFMAIIDLNSKCSSMETIGQSMANDIVNHWSLCQQQYHHHHKHRHHHHNNTIDCTLIGPVNIGNTGAHWIKG